MGQLPHEVHGVRVVQWPRHLTTTREASVGLRNKLFALAYERLMAGGENAGLGEIRSGLLADASGDVLEVGAGTGRNLGHYGADVGTLTLTEPDPSMLRLLERAARAAGRPTTVLRAPAEDLPFDDATFDTVVSTVVLCGVADQPRAAREIRRVLKPGRRLLIIEHVRSAEEDIARRQDRMNWLSRMVSGCECNRPTLHTLQRGDFVTDDLVDGELPKSPSIFRPSSSAPPPAPSTPTPPSSDRDESEERHDHRRHRRPPWRQPDPSERDRHRLHRDR
jgi:SAM-dependent methyltransferase